MKRLPFKKSLAQLRGELARMEKELAYSTVDLEAQKSKRLRKAIHERKRLIRRKLEELT